MAIEIVDLPINSMVIFYSFFLYVYQTGYFKKLNFCPCDFLSLSSPITRHWLSRVACSGGNAISLGRRLRRPGIFWKLSRIPSGND